MTNPTARRLLQSAAEKLALYRVLQPTGEYIGGMPYHILVEQIASWLAANPESKPNAGVTERTPTDYAIEFGGYLADAAEGYLKRPAETDARSADEAYDLDRGLRSAIYEFRKRANLALAAAVPSAPETIPGQWQKMESAPKDGTWVLLWWPHWHHAPVTGYFARGIGLWVADRAVSADGVNPTHWMPLPAAPAVSQPPADTKETGNG